MTKVRKNVVISANVNDVAAALVHCEKCMACR